MGIGTNKKDWKKKKKKKDLKVSQGYREKRERWVRQ